MDVFSLSHDDDTIYTLTEREYLEKTKRNPPYAATASRGTTLYLAVCPGCKNPIEIRHIGSATDINRNNAKNPFGKHYRGPINSLPALKDSVAYQKCPLRGVPSIKSKIPRENEDLNNYILKFLVDNAAAARDLLADIYGVAVGKELFKRCVKYFVARGAYRCQGVSINNLPYSLAYWADSQSLVGQTATSSSPIHAFAGAMRFYALCDNRITKPTTLSDTAEVHLKSKYKPDIKVHCLPVSQLPGDAKARLGRLEVRYVEYGAVQLGKVLHSVVLPYDLDGFSTHAEAIRSRTDQHTLERCAKWRGYALDAIREANAVLYSSLGFPSKESCAQAGE